VVFAVGERYSRNIAAGAGLMTCINGNIGAFGSPAGVLIFSRYGRE